MASRRTQPLRVSASRRQGPALRSAQKGAPAFLTTSHMSRRAATRKRKRRARKRRKDPLDILLHIRKRV